MAAECRRTCGVTFLSASEEQDSAAVAAWRASRWLRLSWLIGPPRFVGNSGSSGFPLRSVIRVRKAVTVARVSGVIRSLRPFPR